MIHGSDARRDTSSIRLLAILLACILVCIPCRGAERLLISANLNQKRPPIKTLAGSWEKHPLGIDLKADSRIEILLPARDQVKNGTVSIDFVPPNYKKPRVPLEAQRDDCLCALKVYAGRCFAQVADNGLSLRRLDSTFADVDTVLGYTRYSLDQLAGVLTLSLSVSDMNTTASLNNFRQVTSPEQGCSFSSVQVATYGSGFILTSISVTSRERDPLVVNKKYKRIDLAAVYHPSHFNAGRGQHNHSFVTWQGGLAAPNALFTTFAPDSAIYDALVSIGAVPGDNLTYYPWSEISDPSNSGPDQKAQGPPVSIEILYGGAAYPASAFVHDENNRPIEFRFSGNRNFIPLMRTGCVVCLESCPGGKIGNATYSMRDLVRNVARFLQLPVTAIEDEGEVTVRISVGKETGGR
jgi:hypothetical protein